MQNCTVPIQFPLHVKQQLDPLKRQGYTIAGFVRRAVVRELSNHQRKQKGKPI